MKIAVDITPIKGELEGHKVRGVGSYINLLRNNLNEYDSSNSYIFFTRGEKISNNVDLIHYPYFDPFFITLPKKKKYKTVVTVHDLIPLLFPSCFPSGIKGKLRWYFQKKSLKKCDAIITDSISSKKDIIKIINAIPEKIHVVYLSVSDKFRKMKKKRLKEIKERLNLPEKFILYVGDATWNKNLPNLVNAVKQTNFCLVMVGKALLENKFDKKNEWNKDLLKVFEETKNDKRFVKVGFVSEEDLVGIYNLATLFVLPSFYEGFGLPVLEAMTCGCPVITTKKGSLEEVGGDAVYYVNPNDIDDIKNGIEKVYNDKNLLAELSEKGLLQARKFLIEKTIKETIKIYESLA